MFSNFGALRGTISRTQTHIQTRSGSRGNCFLQQLHSQGKGQRDFSLSLSLRSTSILRTRGLRKMSTFKLTGKDLGLSLSENEGIGELDVEVTLKDDLTKKELLEFPAFKKWIPRLSHSLSLQHNPTHPFHTHPYSLSSVTVTSYTIFPHPKPHIGFLTLSATLENPKGESLPGSIFLRGASVGMLVVLQPDDVKGGSESEKWVIMTIQPRPAVGSLAFCELPAGMVDGNDGQVKGAAAREIEEEVGLIIEKSDLINLSELALHGKENGDEGEEEDLPKGMFPSAGGCDEFIPLFLYEKRVKRETLKEWTGRLTGLRDEGEKITLKLVRLEDLWREGARDAKALGAWALYEGAKRCGKL